MIELAEKNKEDGQKPFMVDSNNLWSLYIMQGPETFTMTGIFSATFYAMLPFDNNTSTYSFRFSLALPNR